MARHSEFTKEFPNLQVGNIVCMGTPLQGLAPQEELLWEVLEKEDKSAVFEVTYFNVFVGKWKCVLGSNGKLKWEKI